MYGKLKNGIGILFLLGLIALFFSHQNEAVGQALRIITPTQGGTGIGSATVGDIGNCLKVSDESPFTYVLGTCGSTSSGGSNWTIISGGLRTSTSTDFAQASYFKATSTTASIFPNYTATNGTTTYSTSTIVHTGLLLSDSIRAHTSGGLAIDANNGTQVATLGAGGGANATFFGGVNIDGTTRLATSLSGFAFLTSGTVSASSTISASYIDSAIARDTELHNAVTLSGTPDYITLVGQDIVRGTVDVSDDTNLTVTHPILISGDTLSLAFSTTTANTWSLLQTFTYASTTGISGTNVSFTNGTTTTSFFSALGRFTDAIISGTLRLIGSANPTVNEAGEIAYNTTSQSLSFATTTTGGGELPFYPPVSIIVASSSWTGTSTENSWVTLPNYSETILTGNCYANTGAMLIVGNGTASTSGLALSAGTSTVSVNRKFNNGGTRIIFAFGSPTAGNTVASCKFERLYSR